MQELQTASSGHLQGSQCPSFTLDLYTHMVQIPHSDGGETSHTRMRAVLPSVHCGSGSQGTGDRVAHMGFFLSHDLPQTSLYPITEARVWVPPLCS